MPAYEMPANHWYAPVTDERLRENVLGLAKRGLISRAALLELILDKLIGPRWPLEAKAWLAYYGKLAPTAAEIAARQEKLTDLINASSSPVAQFAIKTAGERLQHDPSIAPDLAQPPAYALAHEVQAVAGKAFSLLKND